MWRVVFVERRGYRVYQDIVGPWPPEKETARKWAIWFKQLNYFVILQGQDGSVERMFVGLPS